MDEWDQRIADSRSIETMRRIAQDAMGFGDEGRKHTLKARLRQVLEDEFGCFWG